MSRSSSSNRRGAIPPRARLAARGTRVFIIGEKADFRQVSRCDMSRRGRCQTLEDLVPRTSGRLATRPSRFECLFMSRYRVPAPPRVASGEGGIEKLTGRHDTNAMPAVRGKVPEVAGYANDAQRQREVGRVPLPEKLGWLAQESREGREGSARRSVNGPRADPAGRHLVHRSGRRLDEAERVMVKSPANPPAHREIHPERARARGRVRTFLPARLPRPATGSPSRYRAAWRARPVRDPGARARP